MMKSRPDGGNATDKVLAVLEALGEQERLADIAAATGLARSTVHRILQSLVEHRFAIATGDGRYIGGPVVLTLAGRLMGRFDPAEHADGTHELSALAVDSSANLGAEASVTVLVGGPTTARLLAESSDALLLESDDFPLAEGAGGDPGTPDRVLLIPLLDGGILMYSRTAS
jgi:hypothetical protein